MAGSAHSLDAIQPWWDLLTALAAVSLLLGAMATEADDSERRLRQMFMGSSQPMLSSTPSGRLLVANGSAQALLGMSC